MFTKDTRTETFLTQLGADFKYSNNVHMSQLRPAWDSDNLARPVAVRDEAVVEYASLMEDGSAAPAPIVRELEDSFSVLDGVQRISAAKLNGATRMSAYVVTTDSEDLVASIRVLANARLQGRAEPAEWTRRRAVEVLVGSRGMSCEEVAKLGGWRVADIQAIATAIEWNQTLVQIGAPTLPDTMIEVLRQYVTQAELRRMAEPAAAFLADIKKARFSADDASHYVQAFFAPVAKESKRFRVLADRLDEFRQDQEVSVRLFGRKTPELLPDVKLQRAMRGVITLLKEIVASGEPLVYSDEFFHMSGKIRELLAVACPGRGEKREQELLPADRYKVKT